MKDQDAWRMLIPKEQRPTILSECHEEPVARHFGGGKAYERVATYYYWPTIYRDVSNYVKKFKICQQCEVPQVMQWAIIYALRKETIICQFLWTLLRNG